MKKIIFVLFIMFLSSCEKDEIPFNGEFEKSKETWDMYKKAVNNSYSYISYFVSSEGGYEETKIIVENGKVVGRIFKSFVYPESDVKEYWVENISNLNAHANGAESLTLDEIYQKANNEWLRVDIQKNDVYFTTDMNGLIASCGYVPKGCQDDCFFGVHIKSITSL